jgi:hypothetical protein
MFRNLLITLIVLASLLAVILWQVQRLVGATAGLTATGVFSGMQKVGRAVGRFLTEAGKPSESSADTSQEANQGKQSGQK